MLKKTERKEDIFEVSGQAVRETVQGGDNSPQAYCALLKFWVFYFYKYSFKQLAVEIKSPDIPVICVQPQITNRTKSSRNLESLQVDTQLNVNYIKQEIDKMLQNPYVVFLLVFFLKICSAVWIMHSVLKQFVKPSTLYLITFYVKVTKFYPAV